MSSSRWRRLPPRTTPCAVWRGSSTSAGAPTAGLDGWEHGEVRDDTRRRHPSLVSFDDPRLSADEIAKDIGQIRFLLGSVVRPAQKGRRGPVRRRGDDARDGAQPGISLAALRERLANEPARIRHDRVAADHRTRIGRRRSRWSERSTRRNAILCSSFRNGIRTIKRCAPSCRRGAPALTALLARPQTRIAPIGPAGFLQGRRLGRSGGQPAARAALADYVIKRSHALVAVG